MLDFLGGTETETVSEWKGRQQRNGDPTHRVGVVQVDAVGVLCVFNVHVEGLVSVQVPLVLQNRTS